MGVMDIVHGVLDVAGFIPVVGAVADVANAVIYAAEGDWGNAALSVVSAIPAFGDGIGAVTKGGKLLLKGAKLVEDALAKGKKMLSSFGKRMGKAKTGAKKLFKNSRKNKENMIKRDAKKRAAKQKCFTGDTLVCTTFGLCPIKKIRKGDDIYARNEDTGETGVRKVQEVVRNEAYTIYHIWLDGVEQVQTTAYHPIFVKEIGWVSAINLHEGDLVETMDGKAQITKIVKFRSEEPVEVYNLHVEEWETYFVSEKQIYVHNCGDDTADIIESVENGNTPLKNNMQKGNYGEMKMDAYYEGQGKTSISTDKVTDLNDATHHGIDGVYYNPQKNPPYVIAEAKYGSSKLGMTKDGKQMSDEWITGSNRLENALGGDKALADEVFANCDKELVRVAPDGTLTISKID